VDALWSSYTAGVVAYPMRRKRAAYHYPIRRITKYEDNIIRERLANCIVESKQRNFWMEIKRMRSNKSCMRRIGNGNTDAQSITKLFADKYKDLYTLVAYNNVEFKVIVDHVDKQQIINVSGVKSAVKRLKVHKMMGITACRLII